MTVSAEAVRLADEIATGLLELDARTYRDDSLELEEIEDNADRLAVLFQLAGEYRAARS